MSDQIADFANTVSDLAMEACQGGLKVEDAVNMLVTVAVHLARFNRGDEYARGLVDLVDEIMEAPLPEFIEETIQ